MAMAVAMAVLVLLLAKACGGTTVGLRPDAEERARIPGSRWQNLCELDWVRGCGGSSNTTVEVDEAFDLCKCYIRPTVVATSFTDIRRLQNSYVVLVEMPGVEDVKVEAQQPTSGHVNVLSVAGVSRDEQTRRIRNDRGSLTKLFARNFLLPHHVDANRVSHHLNHGLLRVTLPIVPGSLEQDEQLASDKRKFVLTELRHRRSLCPIPEVDHRGIFRPEPLPLAAHCGSTDDQSRVVTIPALMDVVELNKAQAYEVVVEMAGARSAEVDVECDQAGGCVLSLAGVAEDEDGGHAIRIERGEASRKVFARRLYFPPGQLAGTHSHHLAHGLLRVMLPKPVPVPTLWTSLLLTARTF